MSRTALIAGSTGLVGSRLLALLLAAPEYMRVVAPARRAPAAASDKLEWLCTDFSDPSIFDAKPVAEDAFCCLGTTRKRAGSRAAFERVDLEMAVGLARALRARGTRRFVVLSAVGADARAPAFYSRVKGRMEVALDGLGFESLQILRPSLLLGERAENRPGERAAQRLSPWLSPLLAGPLRRYRPVTAEAVAEAMLELARRGTPGCHVHHLPLEPLR